MATADDSKFGHEGSKGATPKLFDASEADQFASAVQNAVEELAALGDAGKETAAIQEKFLRLLDANNSQLYKTRRASGDVTKATQVYARNLNAARTALSQMGGSGAKVAKIFKTMEKGAVSVSKAMEEMKKGSEDDKKAYAELEKQIEKTAKAKKHFDQVDKKSRAKEVISARGKDVDESDPGRQLYLSLQEKSARRRTLAGFGKGHQAQGQLEVLESAGAIKNGTVDLAGTSAAALAGAAIAVIGKEVAELAKKYEAAALSAKLFGQVAGTAAREMGGGVTASWLNDTRKELDLTREQAAKFFDVMREGMAQAGLTASEIASAAKQLKETFGGDQTERLREYIDLLKSVPTLKEDLQTGGEDAQAAIYGLAASGKASALADLQPSGLLTGGNPQRQEGADMADMSQDAKQKSEAASDFLLNTFYPEWGGYISMVADGFQSLTRVAGVIAGGIGIIKLFELKKLATQSNIVTDQARTAATNATIEAAATQIAISNAASAAAGKAAGKATGKVAGKAVGKFAGSVGGKAGGKFAGSVGGKAGGKFAGVLGKSLKGLGKFAKSGAGKGSGWALALGLASMGLNFAADQRIRKKKGKMDRTDGALKLGAGLAGVGAAALTGASLGSLLGPIGTGVGAVIGAAVGAFENWDSLSKGFKALLQSDKQKRKELNWDKYGEAIGAYAEKQVNSAVALQNALGKLKAAANSAAYKLYEMQKALASQQISRMQKMGGGSAEYANSIALGMRAAQGKYKKDMNAVNEARQKAMTDPNMNAGEREALLQTAAEKGEKALAEFTDSVMNAAKAMAETPEVIKAALYAQMGKRDLQSGVGGEGTAATAFDDILEAGNKAVAEEIKAQEEARAEVSKNAEKLNADKAAALETADLGHLVQRDENGKVTGFDQAGEAELTAEANKKSDELSAKIKDFNENAIFRDFEALRSGGQQYKDLKGQKEQELKAAAEEEREVDADKVEALDKQMEELEKKNKELVDALSTKFQAGQENKKDMREKAINDHFLEEIAKGTSLEELDYFGDRGAGEKFSSDVSGRVEKEIATNNNLEDQHRELANTLSALGMSEGAHDVFDVKSYERVTNKMGEAFNEQISAFRADWKHSDSTFRELAQAQGEMAANVELQQALGSGAGELAGAAAAKYAVIAKGMEIDRNKIAKGEDLAKNIESEIETEKENLANAKSPEERKSLESRITLLQGQLQDTKDAITSTKVEIANKIKEINLGAELENALNNVRQNSLEGRSAGAKSEYAEALGKLAAYSEDFIAAGKEVRELTIAAAEEKARIDLATIAEFESKIEESAAKAAEAVKAAGGTDEDAEKKRQAEIEIGHAKVKAEKAKVEAEKKEKVISAVEQEISLHKRAFSAQTAGLKAALKFRMEFGGSVQEMVGAKQETIELAQRELEQTKAAAAQLAATEGNTLRVQEMQAQITEQEYDIKSKQAEMATYELDLEQQKIALEKDAVNEMARFTEEFGGSFSEVLKYQNKVVDLARQDAVVAQKKVEALKNAGLDKGLTFRRAEIDAQKKVLELRRQEIGVAKGMVDRFLGAAFGGLTDIGARMYENSPQRLMGRENTRVQRADGTFMAGDSETIEERQADRMFHSAFGTEEEANAAKEPETAADKQMSAADKQMEAVEKFADAVNHIGSAPNRDQETRFWSSTKMAPGAKMPAGASSVLMKANALKADALKAEIIKQRAAEFTPKGQKGTQFRSMPIERGDYANRPWAERPTFSEPGQALDLVKMQIKRNGDNAKSMMEDVLWPKDESVARKVMAMREELLQTQRLNRDSAEYAPPTSNMMIASLTDEGKSGESKTFNPGGFTVDGHLTVDMGDMGTRNAQAVLRIIAKNPDAVQSAAMA